MQTDLFGVARGFRLQRFEVLNWGTFDKNVWSLTPDGNNALLTGDIGSGKSTLVDGITTLLVPPQRITYNRAAGAEGRERNVTSYVRGYYKSARDDGGVTAKAVGLRDHTRHSVLLARFDDQGTASSVTIAQVFWMRAGQASPDRFYVIANAPLAIAETFVGFGSDIADLKKRLRKTPGVELYDSFTSYAEEMRHRLGIASEQALTLFYQTVSLKSVGNLTDFVREHMLDEPPIDARVDALCREFENLNEAHEAVVRARRQVEMLTPLIAQCDTLAETTREAAELVACREGLHAYFEERRSELIDERLVRRREELRRAEERREQAVVRRDQLASDVVGLTRAIDENGGNRIGEIEREIAALTLDRARRQTSADRWLALCDVIDVEARLDEDSFTRAHEAVRMKRDTLETRETELDAQRTTFELQKNALQSEHDGLAAELASLKSRRTNIDARMLGIREGICADLAIPVETLPFVGELVQVRSDEAPWRGAIERVLHGFGLSLLVPDALYGRVAAYVDATNLRNRVVYYRVQERLRAAADRPGPDALVRKLEIKHDSDFAPWLERELAARFDYACCDDFEEFKRRPKALSINGQVKSGGERHEKDDRHGLNDRSRYVLGWDNADKIRALEVRRDVLRDEALAVIASLTKLDGERKAHRALRDAVLELTRLQHFSDLDWPSVATRIVSLTEEKERLEGASDTLRELRTRLTDVRSALTSAEALLNEYAVDLGRLQNQIEELGRSAAEARATVGAMPLELRAQLFPRLLSMQSEALGERVVTIESCAAREHDMRVWLQNRIDTHAKRVERLRTDIQRQMHAFKVAFPIETVEADATVEASGEYRTLLERLVAEDLPRHETRFKTMLREGTINDIALLHSQLGNERDRIEHKLEHINGSLGSIDYNDGTYIVLVATQNPDIEIRDFREQLRACLGETLAGDGDALYTETKFQQVKALVDRFRGRAGFIELDARWRRKVIDVRQWSLFSASERWRSDGKEREHYSDSGGKSGGQKEKLAYTILASALIYQYGLADGAARARSFRFVVIDEAFGRGSDESARFALELFAKFGLQLLVVTPLQKIHVIEDYVHTVNLVHNRDGQRSEVLNLTIEQYRADKAARQAQASLELV